MKHEALISIVDEDILYVESHPHPCFFAFAHINKYLKWWALWVFSILDNKAFLELKLFVEGLELTPLETAVAEGYCVDIGIKGELEADIHLEIEIMKFQDLPSFDFKLFLLIFESLLACFSVHQLLVRYFPFNDVCPDP